MEILKVVALALVLGATLLFGACLSSDSYALEYQEHPFSALIAFERGGLLATARLSVTPYLTADGNTERDETLSFLSPDSLAGITVERSGGSITVTCGTLEISDVAASSLLDVTDLFSIDGTVKRVYITELQGESYNCIEVLGVDGKEYKIFLNGLGEPRRISSMTLTVDVLDFEGTDKIE